MPADIYEIRRLNLKRLCGEGRGKQAQLAHKLSWPEATMSAYLRKHKKMGAGKAREVERMLGLPENWLDSATHDLSSEAIQVARDFQSLRPADRDALQQILKRLRQ